MNYIERAKLDAILRILRDLEMLDGYGGGYGIVLDYMEVRLNEAIRLSGSPKAALRHARTARPEFAPNLETVQATLAEGGAPSAL